MNKKKSDNLKRVTLLSFFLFVNFLCFSQASLRVHYDSTATAYFNSVKKCADGGNFFSFGRDSAYLSWCYVIKTDSQGIPLWSKRYRRQIFPLWYNGPDFNDELISTPDSGFYLSIGGIDSEWWLNYDFSTSFIYKMDKFGIATKEIDATVNDNTITYFSDIDTTSNSLLAFIRYTNEIIGYTTTKLWKVDTSLVIQEISLDSIFPINAKFIYSGNTSVGIALIYSKGQSDGGFARLDTSGLVISGSERKYPGFIPVDLIQLDSCFYITGYINNSETKIIKTDFDGNVLYAKIISGIGDRPRLFLKDTTHLILVCGNDTSFKKIEIDSSSNFISGNELNVASTNEIRKFSDFNEKNNFFLLSSIIYPFPIFEKEYTNNPSCYFNSIPLNCVVTSSSQNISTDTILTLSGPLGGGYPITTTYETVNLPGTVICSSACLAAYQVNTPCSTECSGSFTASPLTGTAPFTFVWNTGDTTSFLDSLCSGNYSFTMYDSIGCSSSYNLALQAFNVLTVETSPTCFGDCDGSITVVAQNGHSPFTYIWSTGDTNMTTSNICSGNYFVIVQDANQCSDTVVVNLNEPAQLIANAQMSHNPTCTGCGDGYIVVHSSGGTQPRLITWLPAIGQLSNDTIQNLYQGVYIISVTDANGCDTMFYDTLADQPNFISFLAKENSFSIFPNPTTGKFTLGNAGFGKEMILEIFTPIGQCIHSEKINGQSCAVNCALPAGIYFVKLSNKERSAVKKLLVE